jgi:hypothetical protein
MSAVTLANLLADVAELVLQAQRELARGHTDTANTLRLVAAQMLEAKQ